ncbi:MAG: hypothetical protein ACI4JX_04430, partial [Oscillospiraceae bacterium]
KKFDGEIRKNILALECEAVLSAMKMFCAEAENRRYTCRIARFKAMARGFFSRQNRVRMLLQCLCTAKNE